MRRSLPRSADTLFAREAKSFHQINIAVAQPKLIAGCRRLKRFHSHGLNVWGVCRGCFSPLRHRRVRGRGEHQPRHRRANELAKRRLLLQPHPNGQQTWSGLAGKRLISAYKLALKCGMEIAP